MTSSLVRVRIAWEKMENVPSGEIYTTISKFSEDAEHWPNEAWSIVLEFLPEDKEPKGTYAHAKFLAPNAPVSRLKPGREFELYEGRKQVAKVIVL